MREEQTNFAKYGKTFQEGLSQLIFEDRPFADQITEVLDINFLELEYLRVFVSKVVDYREKYGVHPNFETLISKMGIDINNDLGFFRKNPHCFLF